MGKEASHFSLYLIDMTNMTFTEKSLLERILPEIQYNSSSTYDAHNIGHYIKPNFIHLWTDFYSEINLDNTNSIYSSPDPPNSSVNDKHDLDFIFKTQILDVIKSLSRWDDLKLECVRENVSLLSSGLLASSTPASSDDEPLYSNTGTVDWHLCNSDGAVLLPIALRSKWVISEESPSDITYLREHVIQLFDYMLQNGLQFGILSTYECTWFLKRPKDVPLELYVSECFKRTNVNPTVLQAYNLMVHMATNDPISPRWSQISIELNTCQSPHSHIQTSSTVSGVPRLNPEITLIWSNIHWLSDMGSSRHVFHIFYNEKHLVLKCQYESYEQGASVLKNEVRAYKALQELQGCFIPPLILYGTTFDVPGNAIYYLCTNYIWPAPNARLSKRHKENAITAVKAIHRLKVLHNNIRLESFILGADADKGERLYVIDFRYAKIGTRGGDEITDFMREAEINMVAALFDSLDA
ncbi:1678_t:CDS:2 [Ambispora leptoticha]|uniref:1678_t:CDS:1 n=1 Tax=Ambispora leptoticha TaxID=144679 RepID=A0A9N8V9H8_9GLOM|nr:1678_t:CDS:2 [Ambispora leptoticha]